jgi:hypothetical protein
MKKETAIELNKYVETVKNRYSIKNRQGNYKNEKFILKEIIPTSDQTATVIFEKESKKLACFFFYYINIGASKGWKYFVPTDSHITGMRAFEYYKLNTERHNYKHNFN